MRPTFLDLFCGAGGLSFGLSQAGWRPLLAVDKWEDACRTYLDNHPDVRLLCTSLSDLDPRRLRDDLDMTPDWIVGGPPCQGFSTIGKRERDDPRNRMVWEFLEFVKEIRPRNILVENVIGLRDMDFIDEIRAAFAEVGFTTTAYVLRAADYGVPQLRRRIFFIGDAEGRSVKIPSPTHSPASWVTVWDAIGDLPVVGPGEEATRYTRPPTTDFQRRMRTDSEQLQGHRVSGHPEYLVEAISYIPDGGNRRHIPPEHQPKSGYHNSYSRLHSGSPAVAVTQNMGKPSGTRCIHPFQHRGLTAREGARLQGFPDRYHFAGGVTSQRLQIANAVPPILAELLGHHLGNEESFEVSGAYDYADCEQEPLYLAELAG